MRNINFSVYLVLALQRKISKRQTFYMIYIMLQLMSAQLIVNIQIIRILHNANNKPITIGLIINRMKHYYHPPINSL